MGFSQDVVNKVLVSCGRCCCVCHKFCGRKIELHHIKQKAFGGEDTFENCIPLCFDCHADMGKIDVNHPKGRQYSEEELKGHRDKWYKHISNSEHRTYDDVSSEDMSLFSKICSLFSENIQNRLRDSDMCGIYPSELFSPLFELLHYKNNPNFEFLNSELEELKCGLLDATGNFLSFIACNTFKIEGNSDYKAPRIWLLEHYCMNPKSEEDYKKYREEHYTEFYEQGKHLNGLADTLWRQYSTFIKQGHRIIREGKKDDKL